MMENGKYNDYLAIHEEMWIIEYLGRKVNDEYYATFDHNGYYPSDDYHNYPEYSEKNIIINLKPSLDDKGIINNISYYKVVDHGPYYRRSDDRKLDAHDVKVFKEILDRCTYNYASDILDKLKVMPLLNGWSVKRENKSSLILLHGGECISVPKDYLERMIELASRYYDVVNNNDFWEENKRLLKPKYRDAVMAILSNYNRIQFPSIAFKETAQERINREETVEEAQKTVKSLLDRNNTEEAKEILSNLEDISADILETALKQGNEDIIKVLSEKNLDNYKIKRIAVWCLENDNDSLFKEIVDKKSLETYCDWIYSAFDNNRIGCVEYLLRKGCWLNIGDNRTTLPVKEILSLVEYSDVIWPIKYIQDIYSNENREYIFKIINNVRGQKWDPEKNCFGAGYQMVQMRDIAFWIAQTKDLELIDLAVKKGLLIKDTYTSREDEVFLDAFQTGGEYWNHVKHMLNIEDRDYLEGLLKKCLDENKIDLLLKMIKYFGLSVDSKLLDKAIYRCCSTELIKTLLNSYDPTNDEIEKLNEAFIETENLDLFNYYLKDFPLIIREKDNLDKIRDDLLKNPNESKANLLVEAGYFDETIMKEIKLAKLLPKFDLLQLLQKEINSRSEFNGHYVSIDSTFEMELHDNDEWSIKGLIVNYPKYIPFNAVVLIKGKDIGKVLSLSVITGE